MYMLVTITIVVIMLKIQWRGNIGSSVFTHSSATALWFFLLVYSVTTIMFCFMLSVFFKKADTASAVAGLVWFLFYLPYTFIHLHYDKLSLDAKLVTGIFSNTAMALGFNVIIQFEATEEGLQWSNFFRPATVDDNLHLGHVLTVLVFDAFLYLTITIYVEKVFPGDFGVGENWSFPFSCEYWTRAGMRHRRLPSFIEEFDMNYKNKAVGVQIRRLRKVFGNNFVAVDNLRMNLYEDQITVLLG